MNNNLEISPKKEYQWNQNWANRIAHTDITLVVAELQAIQEVRGVITASLIVESSKNRKSVLHGYFEWDNEKAANKWRLAQASQLLTRIEVKVIKDGEPRIIRAFELTKKNSFTNSSSEYKIFSVESQNIGYIKRVCTEELNRVKKRLFGYGLHEPIEYIDKAIEELQKEEEVKVIPINKTEKVEAV